MCSQSLFALHLEMNSLTAIEQPEGELVSAKHLLDRLGEPTPERPSTSWSPRRMFAASPCVWWTSSEHRTSGTWPGLWRSSSSTMGLWCKASPKLRGRRCSCVDSKKLVTWNQQIGLCQLRCVEWRKNSKVKHSHIKKEKLKVFQGLSKAHPVWKQWHRQTFPASKATSLGLSPPWAFVTCRCWKRLLQSPSVECHSSTCRASRIALGPWPRHLSRFGNTFTGGGICGIVWCSLI